MRADENCGERPKTRSAKFYLNPTAVHKPCRAGKISLLGKMSRSDKRVMA